MNEFSAVSTVIKTVTWEQKSQSITLAQLRKVVDELEALAPPETELIINAGEDQRDRDSWLRIKGTW